MTTVASLRDRALAAKRKEEEDRIAAEAAYREKRRQQAEHDLDLAVSQALTGTNEAIDGTWDDEFRAAYNAPTRIVDGVRFYLNLTDGLVRNGDMQCPEDFLWAAILCAQCGQTAASVQVTPAHASHDPLADLGTLFEMAGDPPMCGVCQPRECLHCGHLMTEGEDGIRLCSVSWCDRGSDLPQD